MGLLTTGSTLNCDVHQTLTVTYSQSRIYGTWSFGSGPSITWYTKVYETHRYASCSFSYVGLTMDAATAIAESLNSYFLRGKKISTWDAENGVFDDQDAGSQTMAEIVARKEAGDMWRVDVSVREEDVRLSKTAESPSTLFLDIVRSYAYNTSTIFPTS